MAGAGALALLPAALAAQTPPDTTPDTASVSGLDRVIFLSGESLYGEVKRLFRGKLEFDTDEMDIVRIDWDDILILLSTQRYEVLDDRGRQYVGTLASAPEMRTLSVGIGAQRALVPFDQVIEIRELNESFISRTDGYLDAGANLVRANRLRSLLVNGRFRYTGLNWEWNFTPEFYLQEQRLENDEGDVFDERTTRSSSKINVQRLLGGLWAAGGSAEIEHNDALDLDVRALTTLGGQYYLLRDRGQELFARAGLVYNLERFTGSTASGSGEVLLALGFDRFDAGDLDLLVNIQTYATPRRGGRFRLNLDSRIAWEIVDDFTIGITVSEQYDSQPGASASNRDYQYGFTIGWSWS